MRQVIYKKDTKDRLRFLEVYSDGKDIVQVSGIVGTDNPVEARKEAKPKNVGRANETTAEEQAIKECNAIILDKLTKGYFGTQNEAMHEEVILPMLAKDYFKEAKKINPHHNVIVQPKFDGIRLLIDIDPEKGTVKMITRQGKELTTVPHVYKEALGILHQLQISGGKRLILDGELYAGTDHTFQECMSLIKKEQKGQEVLQYVVYDMINTEKQYIERLNYLMRFFNVDKYHSYPENPRTICVVPWGLLNKDQLEAKYKEYFEMGYEGMMVKKVEGLYKINGRSSELLKYKKFLDFALEIIDVIPSDARPEQGVVIVDYNGVAVRCGMKLSHKEREEILINKDYYIGKKGEVRAFEITDDGSLRFPVFHGERLDK